MKKVHIIGGGTLSHICPHLSLCAPAYGKTARLLDYLCKKNNTMEVCLHLTKMAGGAMETVEDVARLLDTLKNDPDTKIIFMNAAMCDFNVLEKSNKRLSSRNPINLNLTPATKVIKGIRSGRKDIFLVGFKHTTGETPENQYIAGLNLLKESSCNLVLANDTNRLNMVITPEEAKYHVTTDRMEALTGLVEMAYLRSHLTFTRSTVVDGQPIPWDSPLVPETLRTVVDYCIFQGAYKPFRGATVGHFAVKIDETTFLSSIRKTNFNDLHQNGLVLVKTDGPDSVIAYGSKPSVGGQSQRIVFHDHKNYDCIVHFHCPIKPGSSVPVASQREAECGSHQCGKNTSDHLTKFGNLSAVYLDNHGPNIVFHRSINPQEVIDFINNNFDLSKKTGGPVTLGEILQTPSTLEDLCKI